MTISIKSNSSTKSAFAQLPGTDVAQQPTKKSAAMKAALKNNYEAYNQATNKKLGEALPDSEAITKDAFSPIFRKRFAKEDQLDNLALSAALPGVPDVKEPKKTTFKGLVSSVMTSVLSGINSAKNGIISAAKYVGSLLGAAWGFICKPFKKAQAQKAVDAPKVDYSKSEKACKEAIAEDQLKRDMEEFHQS